MVSASFHRLSSELDEVVEFQKHEVLLDVLVDSLDTELFVAFVHIRFESFLDENRPTYVIIVFS